jgi:hypothetical protein
MTYISRTNVPNIVFDTHLKTLGYAELKVLLVIIRQTYGWLDTRTGTHKKYDWISQQFFVRKTGLSARTVSSAIINLLSKNLITITNKKGKPLNTTQERRRSSRLYFSCNLESSYELTSIKAMKKSNTTIINTTRLYSEEASQGMKRISFNSQSHTKPRT